MNNPDPERRPPRDAEAGRQPRLRAAERGDLAAINALIARAVETWDLPARVKRVSLPLYRYQATDLDFLSMTVALDGDQRIAGVAAWEPADSRAAPEGGRAALLHGIYVDPARVRCGIGALLLAAVVEDARGAGYDGVLVRAQADAIGFFEASGFTRLADAGSRRNYPHRYWLELRADSGRRTARSGDG